MNKNKLIALILALGLGLIALFINGAYQKSDENPLPSETTEQIQLELPVKVISTNPPSLKDGIIAPTQTIEFTLDKEIDQSNRIFQVKLDPEVKFKQEIVSSTTIRITPEAEDGFGFGRTYDIVIPKESEFKGGIKLQDDLKIHFQTISYSGV